MGVIRFLLAVSVLIAHTSPIYGARIVDSQIAVQSFYVISGFYIALILKEKYIDTNGSYKLFITNRLLRLFPVYWIVLMLTVIVSLTEFFLSSGQSMGKLHLYMEYIHLMDYGSLFFLLFTNIFLIFQDVVMFLGLDVTSGHLFFSGNFKQTDPELWKFLLLPQAWTIGIEIIFYFLAPIVVGLRIRSVFALMILSFLVKVFLYLNGLDYDPWTYRFFPSELFFFLVGILAYHIYRFLGNFQMKMPYLRMMYGSILLYTLFYSYIPISGKAYFYFVLLFLSLPCVFMLTKDSIKDRYIGELSYPIYISHILVSMGVRFLDIPTFGSLGFIVLIFTVIFSIGINETVAKRIEIIRQGRIKS